MNFAEALRSTLRQDPDIIMIGEIRDDETAVIASRAAITGHKVYSTIHTKTPREVFFRLEDMGVKNYIIKDALVGIISQRLIRTLCNECKVLEGQVEIKGEKFNVYRKQGCDKCNFTGYKGRALVAAVHHINKEYKRKLNYLYEDDENKKTYYIHKFTYEAIEENTPAKATYVIETYKGDNLLDPIEKVSQVIGFEENKIPAWLIKNGGELGEEFGETDLHDLKPSQDRYNKTTSDVADAIKFSLFGIESGIDLHPDDVGKFNISPGALHVARTSDEALAQGKQGNIQRQEFSLSNLSSVELYLDRIEKDMNTILDMPSLDDMNNIPSAKAMRYLYNDLIARCEEKWNDWGPVLEEVIRYIIAIAEEAKLPGFNPKWKELDFSLIFKHNYPIPADEEERKATAINEVLADVRTRKSYITEFSSAEDAEKEFNDILAEKSLLEGSSMGEFNVNNNSDEDIELDNQNEDDDKTRDPDEE